MNQRLLFLLVVLVVALTSVFAQNEGDYRSKQTGNWGDASTWEVYSSGAWGDAGSAPDGTTGTITIQSGHTVTVASALTVNGATIVVDGTLKNTAGITLSSGTFTFNNGSTYEHALNGGTIPTATWNTGSTCLVTGVTSTVPSGVNQSFYNFTWNCPNQGSTALNLNWNSNITINGNFAILSTGYKNNTSYGIGTTNYSLRMFTGAITATLTVKGDLIISDAYLTPTATSGANITINVEGNVIVGNGTDPTVFSISNNSGAPCTLNVYKDIIFNNNSYFGKSNSSTNKTSYLVFKGNTTQNFIRNGTTTFSNAPGVHVTGTTILNMGTSIYDGCSHCFWLEGGTTLITAHASGVSSTTINCTAVNKPSSPPAPYDGNYFSTSANYIFNGTSAQVTGSLMPATVNNLVIENPAGVTLSQSTTVNGTLILSNGILVTGTNVVTVNSVSRTNGYVYGSLKKTISTATMFEVGTPSGYTPIGIEPFGSGDLTVTTVVGKHPNRIGENVLGMYWTLTAGSGLTGANLVFNYLDGDVNGNESMYQLARWDGSSWSLVGGSINTEENWIAIGGVTQFSDWTLGEGEALPVELTSFVATQSGRGALLQWRTATEVNSAYFEVYRRSAGSEQRTLVGKVQAAGTSNSPKEYTYTDHNVGSGRYVYELKQVDIDGTSEIVGSVEIEILAPKELTLGNYPNPFNPQTVIEFTVPEDGYAVVKVYNVVGQEVATLYNGTAKAGEYYRVTFGGNQLSSGLYYTVLETNGQRVVKKMVLMK